MLWFLRKVFGVIALLWITLLLLSLITCFISPKSFGYAFWDVAFWSWVGAPASIIWAVLKVISVLSTPRVAQPTAVATSYPPRQVPATSPLGLTTLGTPAQAMRIEPPTTPSPAEPKVYTYSAPGVPMCPKCEQQPSIFYCSTHQTGVCLGCVAKHDEPGKCIYVPAFRAPKPSAEASNASG
jgi:hypothetical protein